MEYVPATHRVTDRRLGGLPSGQDVSVAVHRYIGGAGPTVYIQAGQHGIELNGPAALRRLHGRLTEASIAGEIIVVPVANPLAFDGRSYATPVAYDARSPNMNRCWPGDLSGSLVERVTARLWPLAVTADVCLDLHTGTPEMLAHVRHADAADAQQLATVFGTEYRLIDPDPTAGTFRKAAARAGVPAVTVELGNSRSVSRSAAEMGAVGVERVLKELELLPGTADPDDQTVLVDTPAAIRAPVSGVFEPAPELEVGKQVAAGDRVGTIYDPGTYEAAATPSTAEGGVVYSHGNGTVVAGERLAALGARR